MNQTVYNALVSIAKEGSYTTYSDIAPSVNLDMSNPVDRNQIGEILGEISRFEHEQNRPLLSVIVIHRDNNMPGSGFFTLAKELGVYKGKDDFEFFIKELKRVQDFWQNAK